MYRIFNMLIQNLRAIGASVTEVSFKEEYLNIDFTDKDGNKYTGWIRKEDK